MLNFLRLYLKVPFYFLETSINIEEGGYDMRRYFYLPITFTIITILMSFLNLLAFMQLLPFWLTLPLLFFSIYLTLFTLTYRNMYKGVQRRNY